MAHCCEDCARPVSQERERRHHATGPLTGEWVCARVVVKLPLDEGHRVLFGPHGNGGVVVVNKPALDIFRGFGQPRPAEGAGPLSRAQTALGTRTRM